MDNWDEMSAKESSWDNWDLLANKISNATEETPDEVFPVEMDNPAFRDDLTQRGTDVREYTEDDEVYEVDGKPIKYGDMNSVDKARAKLNDFTTEYLGFSTQDKKVGVIDGKREELKDKIINDMDNRQVQEYLGENLIPSKDPDAKRLYIYEVEEANGEKSIKFGKSKDEFEKRYKDQPWVLNNAKLLYDQPLDNADEVEATIRGSKWARENRVFDYGRGKLRGSGATEYHNMNSFLFGKKGTGTNPTAIQARAKATFDDLLSPAQRKVQEEIRQKVFDAPMKKLVDQDMYSEDWKKLSAEDYTKVLTRKNAATHFSPVGAISELELFKSEQYSDQANVIYDEVFPDDPRDNKTEALFRQAIKESKSLVGNEKKQYLKDLHEQAKRLNVNVVELERKPKPLTQYEKNEKVARYMSTMDWNLYGKARVAMAEKSPELAKAYDLARDMYRTTSTTLDQVGSGLKGVVTDPTNVIGLGMFSKFAKSLGPVKLGMLEGAGYGGLDADLDQRIGMQGNKDKKYSTMHTLIGMGAGATLGGTFGHLISPNAKNEVPSMSVDSIRNELVRVQKQLKSVTNKEDRRLFSQKANALNKHIDEYNRIQKIKDANVRARKEKELELKTIGEWANKGFLEQDVSNRQKTKGNIGDTAQEHLITIDKDGNKIVGLNKEGIKARSTHDAIDATTPQKPYKETLDEKNVEISKAQARREAEIENDGENLLVAETEEIGKTNPREGTGILIGARDPIQGRNTDGKTSTTQKEEIEIVDTENNTYKAKLTTPAKDGKNARYLVENKDADVNQYVEVDANGKVLKIINEEPKKTILKPEVITPNRKMKPENLLNKDKEWIKGYESRRKKLVKIRKAEAAKYERLMEESQSPRPGSNKWEKHDANNMPMDYPGGEDAWKAAGQKQREEGDKTQQQRDEEAKAADVAELKQNEIENSYVLKENGEAPRGKDGEVFPDPEYKDIKNYEELVIEKKGDSERFYTVERFYNNHQKGQSGVALLDLKGKVDNVNDIKQIRDYIKELVDSFKNEQKNKKLTGSREVSTSTNAKGIDKTKEEWFAQRLDYQMDKIWQLIKNKDVNAKTRKTLFDDLEVLETQRKQTRNKGVMTDELQAKIDKAYDEQFKINREYDNTPRTKEIKEQFKAASKDTKYINLHENSAYGRMNTKEKKTFVNKMYESLSREKSKLEPKVAQAEARLRDLSKTSKGRLDDVVTVDDTKGVREDKALIQRYRNLEDDLMEFSNGKLGIEEFIFRQTKWADEQLQRNVEQMHNKNIPEDEMIRALQSEFETLGINTFPKMEDTTKGSFPKDVVRKESDRKWSYGDYKIIKRDDGKFATSNKAGEFKKTSVNSLEDAVKQIEAGKEWYKNKKAEEKKNKPLTSEERKALQKKEQDIADFQDKQRIARDNKKKVFEREMDGTSVSERRTQQDYKHGELKITDNQYDFLARGATPSELAEMQFPKNATKETIERLKEDARKALIEKVNNRNRARLKIPREMRFRSDKQVVDFAQTVIDSSNSMLQIMSVLTGNKTFGSKSKLTGTNADVRVEIGEVMKEFYNIGKILDENGKPKSPKDVVKYFFMTENYGQGEKGLIGLAKESHGLSHAEAEKFVQAYYKASDKVLPQIREFRDMINDRMNRPELGSEISWTLPNGDKITMNIKKDAEGIMTIRGQNNELIVRTEELDTASASLMPAYIQSYDAYIVKQMQKLGYEVTNHDSFTIPHGKTEKDVQNAMGEILSDIMESDALKKNVKEMNPDYPFEVTKGDLTRKDIMESSHKMDVEHGPNKGSEEVEQRTRENDGLMTDHELMREFMASSNFRNIPSHSLVNSIIDNVHSNSTFEKMFTSDDPFERQVALAMRDSKYDIEKAIPAPEGVDKKLWDNVQRDIFAEARAKAERFPGLRERVKGERIFFDKNMKDVDNPILTKAEIEEQFRNIDFASRQEHNKAIREKYKEVKARNDKLRKEIRELEKAKAKVLYSNFSHSEKHAMERIGKDYEAIAEKVFGWHSKKTLDEYEAFAKAMVEESMNPSKTPGWYNSLTSKATQQHWGVFFQRQINFNNPSLRQLQKYGNLNKKYSENVAKYVEELKKDWNKKIPKSERKHWVKSLMNTDYVAIRGMDKKMANDFMKEFDDIYKEAKPFIDRAAKGLGQAEKQFGFYYNNPGQIALKLGMPKETIPIIDKMISIKAMDDDAWKFVDMKKDDEVFNEMLDVIHTNQKESRGTLFKENPFSYIKGYIKDKYNKNLTLDAEGKVRLVTETRERGHTPVEQERQTRGRTSKDGANIPGYFENQKKTPTQDANKDLTDLILFELEKMGSIKGKTIDSVVDDIMAKNHIVDTYKDTMAKIIGEELSAPVRKNWTIGDHVIAENLDLKISGKETRRIAQKEIREKLGRSDDFVDKLSETIGSTRLKMGRRNQVKEIKKMTTDELFSNKPKTGFVKIDTEDLVSMAGDLADRFKYVRKEYKSMLLGRDEVTFSNKFGIENHRIRVVDKVFRDAMMRFKKNNVIMNTTSHVTALAYNQAIALSEGVPLMKIAKYQKDGTVAMAEFNEIWKIIANRKSRGKPFDRQLKKLMNNEIYQMQEMGMAVNVVDGVDLSVDTIRQVLGSSWLGKSKVANSVMKNFFAEADSFLGDKFAKSFSWIDTTGRYTMVKHFMSPEGGAHSMQDAVLKANGFFGDMNQMAPAFVQALENYAVPFAKWFASVAPHTIKGFKGKPARYMTVMMGLYLMQVQSDPEGERPWYSTRTSGMGPIVSLIDFFESSFLGGNISDTINDMNRKDKAENLAITLTKRFVPGYITKPGVRMYRNSKNPKRSLMQDVIKSQFTSFVNKDYEDVNGAPLNTISEPEKLLNNALGQDQYNQKKYKRN